MNLEKTFRNPCKKQYEKLTHFLDLFSKPIEWLNKDGVNILIFDKNTTKLVCNPYCNVHRSKYIILIKEKHLHFVPVVHISYIHKNNKINGIFDINNINLNSNLYHYFEKRTTNKKQLEFTKDRSTSIIKIILIHLNVCKFTYQQNTENFIKDLKELELNIEKQIAFTTTQVEFIKVSNYLIPIYPMAIQLNKMIINIKYYVFKILDINDMIELDKYINMYSSDSKAKNKNLIIKLAQYDYKISKIFYDEIKGLITSIQFLNNLIVPIIPEKYTKNRKNQIIDILIKNGELKSKEDNRIETLFRPAYFVFKIVLLLILLILKILSIKISYIITLNMNLVEYYKIIQLIIKK